MSVIGSLFLIVTLFAVIFHIAVPDPFWSVVDIFVAYILGLAVIT